jgi:MFS family permease
VTGVAVDDDAAASGLWRRLLPPLSRPLWLLQAGGLVNAVGDGLVLPFLVIYLYNVRGIGLSTAGLIVATGAAATLLASPLVGAFADAVDARLVLAAALALAVVGLALLPLIDQRTLDRLPGEEPTSVLLHLGLRSLTSSQRLPRTYSTGPLSITRTENGPTFSSDARAWSSFGGPPSLRAASIQRSISPPPIPLASSAA